MSLKRLFYRLSIFFVVLSLFCVSSLPAFALEFAGTAGSGGGSGSSGSTTATGGFAIEDEFAVTSGDSSTYSNPNKILGLRFSIYNIRTEATKGAVIDVYRSKAEYANSHYLPGWNKTTAATKYNKAYLANNYSDVTLTLTNNATYWTDTDLGIELPQYTSYIRDKIVDNRTTLNVIIRTILGDTGATIDSLAYGDRLLIEPIYPVNIENNKCLMTVAEYCVYGGSKFGYDEGTTSSANAGTWSFIADYTNMYFPSALYLDEDNDPETGVFGWGSDLAGKKTRASFEAILTNGYGVAIAYNPDSDRSIKVYYQAKGGTISSSKANVYQVMSSATIDGTTYTNQIIGRKLLAVSAYSMQVYYGDTVNLTDYSFFGLTRSGYQAADGKEWSRTASGKTTYFDMSATYTFDEFCEMAGASFTSTNKTVSLVLAANWEKVPVAEDVLLDIDYNGNGATSGNGWTVEFNATNNSKYTLSNNSKAFERVEVDSTTGTTTLFSLQGWKVGNTVYGFGKSVSTTILRNQAKTTAGRKNPVVTVYAYWDEYPVINAVNRWFSLDDAQGGKITLAELMKTASAVDGEVGDVTNFENGEGEFTIIDYSDEEFKRFTTSGSVTVMYRAIDKVGNETYRMITVYIVDSLSMAPHPNGSPAPVVPKARFVRFISDKYFLDENGDFVPEADGGLHAESAWIKDEDYLFLLEEVLINNQQDTNTGQWDNVYQTWTFTLEEIEEAKAFVETHGLGKTKDDEALMSFYNSFVISD